APQRITDETLVVPIIKASAWSEDAGQKSGVRIAATNERVAFAFVDGGFDESAGIEQADAGFSSKVTLWFSQLNFYGGSCKAAELCRHGAGAEAHLVDECRVNHRGTEEGVIEQWNSDAVDKIADVSGRCTAHEKERKPAGDGRDAWHHFEGAQRIVEGT